MAERNLTTRLNYQISSVAEERLTGYCALSGRSSSDVVRQVVQEFLDGHRAIGTLDRNDGRRTNCTLTADMVTALDVFVAKTPKGITKGSVISSLLESWVPDSAVAVEILRDLVIKVRSGECSETIIKEAEEFLGIDRVEAGRGEKDG